MGIKGLITGDNYNIRVLRREKTSNGFQNVMDWGAETVDSDTGEKKLKLQSDGTIIPKPESKHLETTWYRTFTDKLFGSKSHSDFVEVYLEDGEGGNGDYVKFNPDEKGLDLSGNESQFQAHRDLEAEKDLDIYSKEDNQEWYFLAGLGVITMINLGGMYVIVNGLDSTIKEGVMQGFKQVQSQASNAQAATGLIPLLAMKFRMRKMED